MVNGVYYTEELRWLRQEIVKKRRGKLRRGVLLLPDNAPTNISQVDMAAATKCSFSSSVLCSFSLSVYKSGPSCSKRR